MNLLNLYDYSKDDILSLIELALEFKSGQKKVNYNQEKVVCNLFFEPSTRTHYSFEMAAKRLGCQTISFNPSGSSLEKNETFYDTVKFFEAIQPDALVIRSSEDNYYEQFNNLEVPLINGGDGKSNHPTQSLLDLVTIYENFNTISGLKVLIVGDIKHSRVAHTNIDILERLGNEVFLTGPKPFQEEGLFFVDFDEYISKVDVVMLLRMQFERHSEDSGLNYDTYLDEYGLNKKRYALMKDEAIIIHPAPFNRGLEIDTDLVESPKSKIFEQMRNGLYLRMAVLYNAFK
ncbi:MAG: aspartate carbamoyltransferase catalytic subunit [Bacilli bacterium]|jgi:aspartate carbamoyltransferase catalytic subunit|nr:aspartate carbamoyltransferase catalytic subunit [Bacilli bacterium]